MKADTSILKTVDKALQVIEFLSKNYAEIGISDIARIIGVNKSTTYRILNTLLVHDFVVQNNKSSMYKLGAKIMQIGCEMLESIDIRQQAHQFIEELRNKTNETVNLILMEDGQAVYIDRIDSPHRLRMVSSVGTREEMHCTGVGKAFLAFHPEEEVNRIIDRHGLPRKTSNTIINAKELKAHLRTIKELGYSIDNEESEIGIICVGAPILDKKNNAVAAISVSAPASRLNSKEMAKIIPEVKATALKISRAIGLI